MPTTGSVFIEILPGHLRIVVEGDDPSHPWELVLPPQAAFNLGNELRVKAEDLQTLMRTTVRAQSRAQPVRRPPSNQLRGNGQVPASGPQSSTDGGAPAPPDSMMPRQPPLPSEQVSTLLGDDFG